MKAVDTNFATTESCAKSTFIASVYHFSALRKRCFSGQLSCEEQYFYDKEKLSIIFCPLPSQTFVTFSYSPMIRYDSLWCDRYSKYMMDQIIVSTNNLLNYSWSVIWVTGLKGASTKDVHRFFNKEAALLTNLFENFCFKLFANPNISGNEIIEHLFYSRNQAFPFRFYEHANGARNL